MVIHVASALPRLYTAISFRLSRSPHVFQVFLFVRVFGNVNGLGRPLSLPRWSLILPAFVEGLRPRTLLLQQYLLRVVFGQFISFYINIALPCFIFEGLHEAATKLINFAESVYVEIFGILHLP